MCRLSDKQDGGSAWKLGERSFPGSHPPRHAEPHARSKGGRGSTHIPAKPTGIWDRGYSAFWANQHSLHTPTHWRRRTCRGGFWAGGVKVLSHGVLDGRAHL